MFKANKKNCFNMQNKEKSVTALVYNNISNGHEKNFNSLVTTKGNRSELNSSAESDC